MEDRPRISSQRSSGTIKRKTVDADQLKKEERRMNGTESRICRSSFFDLRIL
jgi:hypothetical protein